MSNGILNNNMYRQLVHYFEIIITACEHNYYYNNYILLMLVSG